MSTYLDLLLVQGNALYDFETRYLVGLRVFLVCGFQYSFIPGSVEGKARLVRSPIKPRFLGNAPDNHPSFSRLGASQLTCEGSILSSFPFILGMFLGIDLYDGELSQGLGGRRMVLRLVGIGSHGVCGVLEGGRRGVCRCHDSEGVVEGGIEGIGITNEGTASEKRAKWQTREGVVLAKERKDQHARRSWRLS